MKKIARAIAGLCASLAMALSAAFGPVAAYAQTPAPEPSPIPEEFSDEPLPSPPPLPTLPPDVEPPGSLPPGQQPARTSPVLPLVYALNLTASAGPDGMIRGSFAIENRGNAVVGGLGYELLILSPFAVPEDGTVAIDDPTLYARDVRKEALTIGPGQSRTVSFTYRPPPFPRGDYRLRVQLLLEPDRRLGWDTVPLTLGVSAAFGVLSELRVEVNSVDPLTKEPGTSWGPVEGVNVSPGQSLTLKARARNSGTEPLSASPTVTVRRALAVDPQPTVTRGEPLTLAPGEERDLALPLTAASVPGAYAVVLSLEQHNGYPSSTLAEYRYVVRGLSASIVSQTLKKSGVRRGETADVGLAVAGAADRETTFAGTAEIELSTGTKSAGRTSLPVTINPGEVLTGTARIRLTRDFCTDPVIRTRLATSDGRVLAALETTIAPETLPGCAVTSGARTGATPQIILLLISLLVLVALLLLLRARRTPGPFPPSGPTTVASVLLLGMALGGALLVGHASLSILRARDAHAQSEQFFWASAVSLASGDFFVNDPIWEEHFEDPQQGKKGVRHEAAAFYSQSCARPCRFAVFSQEGLGAGGPWQFQYSSPSLTKSQSGYLTATGQLDYRTYPAGDVTVRTRFTIPQTGESGSGGKSYTSLLVPTSLHRPPPAPTGLTASCPAPGSTGTVSWNVAPTATEYLVSIDNKKNPPSGSVNCDKPLNPGDVCVWTEATSYSFPSEPGATYGWRIYARNHAGLHSPRSVRGPAFTCGLPEPDLTVVDVTYSGTTTVGGTLTFSGTVLNSGTGNAGPTTTKFSIDPTPTSGQIGTQPTGALPPNGTERESMTWTATLGTHELEICADDGNVVPETDENNNCTSIFVTVVSRPPVCTPASQPAVVNQTVTFTASRGDGSYSWSAPGGTPSSGSGTPFATQYGETGTKTITVTSGTESASCTAEVTAGPLPAPQFREVAP